jgi:hypothetical protein
MGLAMGAAMGVAMGVAMGPALGVALGSVTDPALEILCMGETTVLRKIPKIELILARACKVCVRPAVSLPASMGNVTTPSRVKPLIRVATTTSFTRREMPSIVPRIRDVLR